MIALLLSLMVFLGAASMVYKAGLAWAPQYALRRRLAQIQHGFEPAAAQVQLSPFEKARFYLDKAMTRLLYRLGLEENAILSVDKLPGCKAGLRVLLPAAALATWTGAIRFCSNMGFPSLFALLVGSGAVWLGMRVMAVMWFSSCTKRRQAVISESLVEVLDLWILCLGSGMSLQSAMVKVAQEPDMVHPVFQKELQLTNEEILAGCPREEALRNLSRRCGDSMEMRALVAHIVQSEKLGTSLGTTLKSYADTIRFKRKQDAKEMIYKLPAKLAFPLILLILPALFIVIIGPAAIQLMRAF